MYIESVPNRNSPPCILLRESYRDRGKVRKRTLANITNWPPEVVEGLRSLIKGGTVVDATEDGFQIVRSLPHGHVASVLKTLKTTGLDKLIASRRCPERDIVLAMIVARVINPCSKLSTARGLNHETAFTSLGELLDVSFAEENDLYQAMDWLLKRQPAIEEALARRHLCNGTLLLYDITSTYFEGKTCPLARYGHNRDGKKNKLQIVFGLLCDVEGRPIATEVFEGNMGDPSTLSVQVQNIRDRFGLTRVVLVGDRGMITEARINNDLRPIEGLDWITALRAPAIRKLVVEGAFQPSLFDQRYLAEISSPEYPNERLIVCRNPILAEERRLKREGLLLATERELGKIVAATRRKRNPLRGSDKIGIRIGKVLNKFKVGKHFHIEISNTSFQYQRDETKIAQEQALDGFYLIRTSVPAKAMDAEQTVGAYKSLSVVERAFRSIKTVDLKVRPIYHRLPDRVRCHVFLCMLAYYVEWHMRKALAPILFDDNDKAAADAQRKSVVASAQRSEKAKGKAAHKRTHDDYPVHSFQDLLKDLGTIVKNKIRFSLGEDRSFEKITRPTPFQARALDLLGIHL